MFIYLRDVGGEINFLVNRANLNWVPIYISFNDVSY